MRPHTEQEKKELLAKIELAEKEIRIRQTVISKWREELKEGVGTIDPVWLKEAIEKIATDPFTIAIKKSYADEGKKVGFDDRRRETSKGTLGVGRGNTRITA